MKRIPICPVKLNNIFKMYNPIYVRPVSMIRILSVALLCALALSLRPASAFAANPKFVFSCSAENDLYVLLKKSGLKPERHETPEKAVTAAARDSIVLLLADGYPTNTLNISEAIFKIADQKNIRLYVEFPS